VPFLELSSSVQPPTADCVVVKTTALASRTRLIEAWIETCIGSSALWPVLTDYDHLADFVPNLALSRRLPSEPQRLLVEQIGTQCFFGLRFSARAVLEMTEAYPEAVHFEMLEGDFAEFIGSWHLLPRQDGQTGTRLAYTVQITIPLTMPVRLIEQRLQEDLRINLNAICRQAEQLGETMLNRST
jgi:ribosome-associated toxin RatA of RatAB toxin-antitoxin module